MECACFCLVWGQAVAVTSGTAIRFMNEEEEEVGGKVAPYT